MQLRAGESKTLIKLESVQKYRNGKKILEKISLSVDRNQLINIVGKSGSGKTTLLKICALVDREFKGKIYFNGIEPYSSRMDSYFRLYEIGYIPQFHDLIEQLTVIENVKLPLLLQGKEKDECERCALEAIEKVGIRGIADKLPAEISGGEAQRVAIARAIAKKPSIIIADEPTSCLDTESEEIVMREIKDLVRNGGCAIITSTHDEEVLAKYADHHYLMQNGELK